jgi:hypothetical protein
LSWLAVIALFLWVSLICSIGHNSTFVRIAGLEAEQSREWSNYLGLINASATAHAHGSPGTGEIVDKVLLDTFHDRIQKAALKATKEARSLKLVVSLGRVAVSSFLLAYTLVLVGVIRLWWLTR